MQRITKFINDWTDDTLGLKPTFASLYQELQDKKDIEIEFNERPGISYSLRGVPKTDNGLPLFVMIDVIDDDPEQRWLSVCFYGDTIKDPEEEGDLIPEGLLGDDGYCFDLTKTDESMAQYVRQRIKEAYETVCMNENL